MALQTVLREAAHHAGCEDRDALDRALSEATKDGISPIERLLEEELFSDEESFFEALAKGLSMPFQAESEIDLSEPLHNRFPAKLALQYRVMPTHLNGKTIALLTYDPFNLNIKQAVAQELEESVSWVLSSRTQILESLRRGYGIAAGNFDELIEGRDFDNAEDILAQEVNVLEENQEDEDATVNSFVNQVFREALNERATDIHVEPLERDLRIRYRVDGALQEVPVPPNVRLLQASLISRLKIMANLDIAERRLPQDGRINLELDSKRIDVRVATIPSVNGESVSLRLLSRETYDFGTLGLDEEMEARVRELLAMPNGIILVTGPTGSGKSTTLYTFLRALNTKDRRIVTVEDPVENKLDGVVQIAVKPEIDLTFASGLRSILRGDPNVIMIGEMRDLETTETAIRGALTGHLVFSTLHTNDAVGGISRLLDMGIEPFLIASSVRAFLAQRLVRTLCSSCAVSAADEYTDHYLENIGFPVAKKAGVMKAVGCRECRNTGYRGRMAIMEVCGISQELQEMVSDSAPAGALRKKAVAEGMVPLREYGWSKVAQGKTTIEEILNVTAGDGGSH
jgi:general secretion pathway protein E/type IV pilus assembly protein PilB